jgi:hypothetical protein
MFAGKKKDGKYNKTTYLLTGKKITIHKNIDSLTITSLLKFRRQISSANPKSEIIPQKSKRFSTKAYKMCKSNSPNQQV